jgi:hypothetical protein
MHQASSCFDSPGGQLRKSTGVIAHRLTSAERITRSDIVKGTKPLGLALAERPASRPSRDNPRQAKK